MNIVDLIIAMMILIPGIMGFYRGLVLTVVGLIGTIANWYLAFRFYPYILHMLYTSEHLVDFIRNLTLKAPDQDKAAFIVLSLLSFVLTYLLINLAIKIIISIVNGIASLPLLRGINKLGGLIAGTAEGFLLTCFIFLILYIAEDIIPAGGMAAIADSTMGDWFLTNNPFINLIPVELYIWKEIVLWIKR
ncbi:MAG: CvpA family protein [Thermoanaerobacteraceae bacterium]|nr:CvpA family protein [Thermoanaerobacteraceae bacterium]